ncbi:MAG: rpoH [Gammaproteobacteria bacterium]|jgi:RNA polymerase sigma-32 factor|nr:rpoH [Gammaproteobacteria bacterium]
MLKYLPLKFLKGERLMNRFPLISASVAVPIGSLDAYMAMVNRIPLLSQEEEYDLAKDYLENNSLEAAKKLVLAHLRYVVKIARGYDGYGLQISDLIQEGNIGLMKAVKRFDPTMGVRLVSFAVHWIKAEIHDFIIRNWRIVKVATTKAQRKLFFNLRKVKKGLNWLTHREMSDIAQELNVPVGDVKEMEMRLHAHDADIHYQMDDDEQTTLAPPFPLHYLADAEANPEVQFAKADHGARSVDGLRQALTKLDVRSRDILERRWLTESAKVTLEDLAKEYGISIERVRQIEKAAMKKLKDWI